MFLFKKDGEWGIRDQGLGIRY